MEAQRSGRRRRPARSCVECRRRKIKCDRNNPCTHCTTSKANCTYRVYVSDSTVQPQSRGDDLSVLTQTISSGRTEPSAVHQWNSSGGVGLDQHNFLVKSGTLPTSTEQTRTHNTLDDDRGDTTLNGSPRGEPDLQHRVQRARQLDRFSPQSYTNAFSERNQAELVLQSRLQDKQISLDKARVIRWTQWWGAAQEFETLIACFNDYSRSGSPILSQDAEYATTVTVIRELLAECKMLARMMKTERPSRTLPTPALRLTHPPRATADTMAKRYFDSFESAYRILHGPTFRTEYEKHWVSPENTPINQRLKILLVIAIAFGLEKPTDENAEFRSTCLQWIYVAQTWLSGPLEKDRLDVSGLQIHCLTILAREIFSVGGDLLWMSMGSLVHRGMQIGLHRDPKHLPVRSLLQAEVRRRLWVTILEMVVQSSLDAEMPPRISFDEFDTQPPSNIDDEELDESTRALRPRPKNFYTSTSMQLTLLDSLPTRLRVVQLLNGTHSELSYLDVLALTSEVTNACRVSSDFMREHAESRATAFHRNMLDFMVRRFLLPLHSPFASQARKNLLFSYSLKLNLNTSIAIMSPEPDEGFHNLRTAGGGSFKESFRSTTVAIGLELLSQVEFQRRDGTLHRSSQHIELLKKAVTDSIDFSLERIQCGETNIKHHMFLSMMLAQAEAVELGTPCELRMTQSARRSIELCHSVLRSRVDASPSPHSGYTDFSTFYGGDDNFGMDLELDSFLTDMNPSWS